MKTTKIAVFGIGYVGLSNAILLAQHNEVVAVDVSPERVDRLNCRNAFLDDPELKEYLSERELRLSATTDPIEAIEGADFVVVATPTNYDPERNFFDTSSVKFVINTVVESNPLAHIVIKSTIPVGFTQDMRKRFGTDRIFFSPEFLREGRALQDNLYPSRIVVGDKSPKAKEFADLLLAGAKKEDVPVLFTDPSEAEAIKLFSNTYLAMRVAFFNELDSYSLAKGMNSKQIIEGASLDPRIGEHYNNPSFGYGGYCLPKDTKQLLANFECIPQELIGAVVKSNETRMDFLAEQIIARKPKRIGIYRLAMKSGSDNWRQSAILGLVSRLRKSGIELLIYEPSIKEESFFGNEVCMDLDMFKKACDIILTNRFDQGLLDVFDKVFTRDIFGSD